MSLLLRWLLMAVALFLTVQLGVGISVVGEGPLPLLLAALVVGLVYAVVRPVMVLLTLPVTVLSFGLFLFVINAVALIIAAAISPLQVSGFWGALWGALLLSLINAVLTRLFAPRL
jgi:putative membrane protein